MFNSGMFGYKPTIWMPKVHWHSYSVPVCLTEHVTVMAHINVHMKSNRTSLGQRTYTRFAQPAPPSKLCYPFGPLVIDGPSVAPTHPVRKRGHPDAARFIVLLLWASGEHALDRARGERRRPRRYLRLLLQAARTRPVRRRAPAHRTRRSADRVRGHPVWMGRRARRCPWEGCRRVVPRRTRQSHRAKGGRQAVRGAPFPRWKIHAKVSFLGFAFFFFRLFGARSKEINDAIGARAGLVAVIFLNLILIPFSLVIGLWKRNTNLISRRILVSRRLLSCHGGMMSPRRNYINTLHFLWCGITWRRSSHDNGPSLGAKQILLHYK